MITHSFIAINYELLSRFQHSLGSRLGCDVWLVGGGTVQAPKRAVSRRHRTGEENVEITVKMAKSDAWPARWFFNWHRNMGNFDESVWNCAHSIMPKTPFGGGSGSATDVESLLTLHGVLCAFLVSLSIGFEANLAAASTERR